MENDETEQELELERWVEEGGNAIAETIDKEETKESLENPLPLKKELNSHQAS